MVSQKIFTLLIVFSNLYLISSNVTDNQYMKMIIIVFRVPFLEVLHNNETGIFVKHVKLEHLTNKWVRGRVI